MKRRNKRAFTIIELIVVIAILGILILLGMNKFTGNVKKAQHTKVMVATKTIEDASGMYHMDNDDWPRLTDEPYSDVQLQAFATKFYDTNGKAITLDDEGKYYDIDYEKLAPYAKAPENKKDYILQNPVGKIFYMENLNEAGENRVDYVAKKQVNSSIPSMPAVSEITENSVIVTGQDGVEVRLNDGEWFNSPHTFTNLDDNTEYAVYARFRATESKLPSKLSEGVKFTTSSGQLYEFTTHTFTNAGQTGRFGPSQAQLNNAYKNSKVEGNVISNNGIQEWTVPKDGTYRIETYGAQGGANSEIISGLGAIMIGNIKLTFGEKISILVGQMGKGQDHPPNGFSGGGGSFVVKESQPIIIAGGGGSHWKGSPYNSNILNANINEGGKFTSSSIIGSLGHGGKTKSNTGPGGGMYSDGEGLGGGIAFVNGGFGAITNEHGITEGGFGGGGARSGGHGEGSGGGYSGGNGHSIAGVWVGGTGGGSFNSGTSQINSVGNTGHGKVIITYIGK